MNAFTGIRHWDLIAMFIGMAVIFTFEMLGVFSTKMVTLTMIIKAYTPMPLRWMIIGWLFWHFIGSDLWTVKTT